MFCAQRPSDHTQADAHRRHAVRVQDVSQEVQLPELAATAREEARGGQRQGVPVRRVREEVL